MLFRIMLRAAQVLSCVKSEVSVLIEVTDDDRYIPPTYVLIALLVRGLVLGFASDLLLFFD
jgi:hypothetical protein